MTFVELKKTNFDNANIKVFPQQNFISGSSLALNTLIGEFGCVPAIRTRSKSIKELDNRSNFITTLNYYESVEDRKRNNSGTSATRNHGLSHLLGLYGSVNKAQSDNFFFKVTRNTIKYKRPESTIDDLGRELSYENKNDAFHRKLLVKNSLYNKYKTFARNSEDYNYGFSNYNSLNFYTLGVHPSYTADATVSKKSHKTCVIYPNPNSNTYTPSTMLGDSGEYSVSFWINPRRTNVNGYDYNAGTIISIPGIISAYLVKGTSKNEFGYADKFRLIIDLAASSYLLPDASMLSNSSAKVISNTRIISGDNLLDINKWYHISIVFKNKMLRLYVDGNSVLDNVTNIENIDTATSDISKVIYIGNRHNYSNKTSWANAFSNLYNYYFGSDAASEFSSFDNGTDGGRSSAISSFGGSLPVFEDDLDTSSSDSLALNAELADIRIYNTARLEQQVLLDKKNYIDSLTNEVHLGLLFYVPIYFVPEKRVRKALITYGNKHSINIDGPVNPYLSNRILGHDVSVEHFLNEFVKKYRPFIEGVNPLESDLSATTLSGEYTTELSANESLNKAFITDDNTKTLRQNNLILRNHLIIPNDNGLTYPSWKLIEEVYPDASSFIYSKDIFGNFVPGLVSVNEIADLNKISASGAGLAGLASPTDIQLVNFPNGSLYRKNRKPNSIFNTKENIVFSANNFNPDEIDDSNEVLRILSHQGRILSHPNIFSNASITSTLSLANFPEQIRRLLVLYEMTSYLGDTYGPVFEIPNAFYSSQIKEETVEIEDKDIAGTAGALQIKLKDNQSGGMYRADCLTKHATWNYVGHTFRSEGFISLLHPGLASFGEVSYDLKLKGNHGLNVFEINVPCNAGEHNVSLNSSFKKIKPTDYFSDTDENFVFIDTINLHDENLNIIAKANLSQPLTKRVTDKYNFRLKLDY